MRNLALKNPRFTTSGATRAKNKNHSANCMTKTASIQFFHLFPGWVLSCKIEIFKAIISKFILLVSESNLYLLTLASVLSCPVSVEEFNLTEE